MPQVELPPEGFVYYFAFGANINPKVHGKEASDRYQGRRTHFVQAQPARLPGYRLVFNLRGFAFGEPCFGNVEKIDDEEVHGVCYCISQDALARLHESEFPYKVIDVQVDTYDGKRLQAKTLQASSVRDIEECPKCSVPSRRYWSLIVEGCRYWKLKPEYIEKLERIRYFAPTRLYNTLSRVFLWFIQVGLAKLKVPMVYRKYIYFFICRVSWWLVDLKHLVSHNHS
ncbi:hypothetical protein GpartN1_g2860.t1 [Galdieria partita]|uniref:gamma-glutamylcyclotransferase n=1 Tax=Galdieria partita TaxID=83374 RepID=A0A9C7PSZ5_9RHOD|nr:hypothetical protein GpartN1_g1959.t1 [Galdieria partita]GJQ11069.1 hypothetical protein GpartN1_g2860.t1 [Galdieria partita]